MLQVPDWEEKRKRYESFWNRTNETPIISIWGEIENPKYDESLQNVESDTFWFDPQWQIKSLRDGIKNTYYGGDSYPYISPSLGPHLMSAIMGLEMDYNEASAWIKEKDCELSEFQDFSLDKENFYFKKMKEMLTAYCEDAGDDYVVGMVDLNTLVDGVASLIGSERLCFEVMDHPEEILRTSKAHFELYKQVFTEFDNILKKYNMGSTNWLGLYSDIPWYFISVDIMCMLSPNDFDEFILPTLRDMIEFNGRMFFHLDGENAIVHLDKLLTIESLNGIQVQATPFVHTATYWIEHIKKIQAAGKNVIVAAKDRDDLMNLLENVSPVGLYVSIDMKTEAAARNLEEEIKNFYAK